MKKIQWLFDAYDSSLHVHPQGWGPTEEQTEYAITR